MAESIRVLHVDDEPEFTDLTATFLEREDGRYDVATATSASDGLDRLTDDVDCVVSDYEMPGMDGLEFLDAVRTDYPELPFILFTGKGSEQVASEALRKGATDYLQKRGGSEQYELLANRVRNAVEQHRSQRRLDRQRQEYQRLFEQAPVMFAIFRDEDGEPIFEDCNERFATKLGFDPEALRGRSMREFYTDESVEQAIEGDGFRRALTGEFTTEERSLRTKDGDTIDVLVRAVPQADATGTVTGALALYVDVTERKEREQELERFEAIVTASGDPVYTVDADGRFTLVNDALLAMTGYEESDLLGAHFSTLLVREDKERGGSIIRSLRFSDVDRRTTEVRVVGVDGERIPCEINFTPLPFDEQFRGAVGVIRDISDRVERERKLKRYKTFVEASGDPLFALDADGEITFVNEAFVDLTGYDRDTLVGNDPSVFTTQEAIERGQEVISSLYTSTADRETFEIDVITAHGDRIPCENHVALLPFDDGFQGTVAVLRDISDRKERERELERQNERLEEFASLVSHDLRNPLQVAEGRIELIREEHDIDHLDAVGDALARSQALIDDLLTLARNGETVSEMEAVDLGQTIKGCWRTVETGDARLVVDTERRIRADPDRLKQLLENLVRNAVEHGSTGPRTEAHEDAVGDGHTAGSQTLQHSVTVTVGDIPGGFYVADDGPGIPETERAEVFESGYSTSPDGTGFGLAIVEEIAEAHGWEVHVTDSADGGARFEIIGVGIED